MTEAEWMTSEDPSAMLGVVAETVFRQGWPHHTRTQRKRSLFAAACCRLIWPLIVVDDSCRRVVEWMEAHDEPVPEEESEEIWRTINQAARHPEEGTSPHRTLVPNLMLDADDPRDLIGYLLRSFEDWGDVKGREKQIAGIMRDVTGNPFRPVTFDPAWRTSTAVGLAETIYADRAFDRLPILADALQDAGCEDADLLGHLRSDGPHVRGCWALDLVLGKE